MINTARWPALALAGWSIVVWGGRLRNLAADEQLTLGRSALALSFIVGGIAVAIASLRRAAWLAPALTALAGWTIVVWTVRGVGILLDNHEVAFELVHTVLAVVSIGLAALALRSVAASGSDRRRAPASGSGSRLRP